MASQNRHDFAAKTKRALAERAGYQCSFRGCPKHTSGPSDVSAMGTVNIGVASHIHGASPKGPRYLDSMKKEERIDISNAIWMCQDHGKLIDDDEEKYTAVELKKMKAEHEQKIALQISHPGIERTHVGFIALGSRLVFRGELIGTNASEWTLRLEHFLIGDLSVLIDFCENFLVIDPIDRFVLLNDIGDGRQLSLPPTWKRSNDVYEIQCTVNKSFPRTNVNKLGRDLALGCSHDLFLDKLGDFATVEGQASFPQVVSTALSAMRGEALYDSNLGSKIAEYFSDFDGSPMLGQLIKLEVIRLACIPYSDQITSSLFTPLKSVQKVRKVEALPSQRNGNWLPFYFEFDVEGIGEWTKEISLYIPV